MHAVVHAEVNAIMYKNCVDLEGCTLYTTLFPCLECAKSIIRSKLKKVYYLTNYLEKEMKWDDEGVDDSWEANGDKLTYVASRCLLWKYFASDKEEAQRTKKW